MQNKYIVCNYSENAACSKLIPQENNKYIYITYIIFFIVMFNAPIQLIYNTCKT